MVDLDENLALAHARLVHELFGIEHGTARHSLLAEDLHGLVVTQRRNVAATAMPTLSGELLLMPGITHWNHPGWFGYFPGNNSPPSILAEMLTATLGAQCMSWQTSPAATELEQVTLDWLRGMIGLPAEFTGVIQDTASTATLVALISARERATKHGWSAKGPGHGGAPLAVYASAEAHSSVAKGVKLAGYGSAMLRAIPVDERYAMNAAVLREAIEADRASGIQPACVVATIGRTQRGSNSAGA